MKKFLIALSILFLGSVTVLMPVISYTSWKQQQEFSNGALACFLYKNSEVKKLSYVFTQGYSLDLASEILVKLEANANDEIEKVFVGGEGYFVSEKELEI